MSRGRSADLTGVWLGLYSYPHALAPVGFVATLIETAGTISGSSHESLKGGTFAANTAFASLSGIRNEGAVGFVKIYDDGIPHKLAINYTGTLADDGAEIEGRWMIPGQWSGRFLMIRSRPNAETVVRKKFVRA
jgi:hypothetical protein